METSASGAEGTTTSPEDAMMSIADVIDPNHAEPITRPVQILVDDGTEKPIILNNNLESSILKIALDEKERNLFDALVQTAHALEEGTISLSSPDKNEGADYTNTKIKKSVQIRVAGGWVRDKLLGLPTHDVDIAVDTCTGVEFATYFKEYMTAHGEDNSVGRIGVIAANPAQSKHLETATLKAFGLEIDFSNLRHETYAEDSRIPTVMIGTPLEDSYRRDFTMNALYYHLQSQQVEDWTRQGLNDLLSSSTAASDPVSRRLSGISGYSHQQVKTPLPAYQTFHDDPLRVLRAIRFAVRYQMQLSEDLKNAAMHPQIHGELHRKVSRERVGKELEGMLSGKSSNPIQALKLICDLKLAGSVFCIPSDDIIMGPIGHNHLDPVTYSANDKPGYDQLRESAWEESRECLRLLPKVLNALYLNSDHDHINSRMLYLSVVLLPYERLQYTAKNRAKSVIEYMVRDGIKFKNKDAVAMVTINEQLDAMTQLLQTTPEVTPPGRLRAGLILRATKELWVTTLVVATVALRRKSDSSNASPNITRIDWYQRAQEWYKAISQDLNLHGCWNVKPLLNGKDIISFLKLEKGPQVGIYSQEIVSWMLQYPEGSLEECKQHLKQYQKRRELEQDETAQHVAKKMHL